MGFGFPSGNEASYMPGKIQAAVNFVAVFGKDFLDRAANCSIAGGCVAPLEAAGIFL